jgi:regulatory protein
VALIEERAAEHEPPDDDVQAAAQAALQYLNRRDRTVSETWRRLARGGYDAAAIEAAISRLLEDGLLDDARYARLYAEDRRNLDQWGTTRIRRALLERGVDRELVERTLSSHGVDAELDQAVALLRQRFPTAPSTRRERDRALGLLLRRGYDSELALQALAAYGTDGLEDG